MRLLVIDDRPMLVDLLCSFLRTKTAPDGELFSVEVETSYERALEHVKLAGNRLDAVVIDDRPARAGESLALEVIRACEQQRLIAIVVTGGPDLQRCVRAMRAGASDYLRKGAPEQLQEDLARSLAEAAERRGMYAPDPDAAWIETHFEDLVPVHGGKYVVVHAGRIVDSCESYPDVARVVRAFTKGAPFICYVPKP